MFKKLAVLLLAFVLILQTMVTPVAAYDEDTYEAYEPSVAYDAYAQDEEATDYDAYVPEASDLEAYDYDAYFKAYAGYLEIEALSGGITTEAQLRSAIENAGTETTTIVVDGNILLTSPLVVDGGRHIVITGGGRLTVASNIRHFEVVGTFQAQSSLTLAGYITLTRAEGFEGYGGGVVVNGRGNDFEGNTHLTLLNNANIINNSVSGHGGGVFLRGGTVNLHHNSRVERNHATQSGGGISANAGSRCGVYLYDNSSVSYNVAGFNGGGLVFGGLDDLLMEGGRINGNTALNGGGISTQGGTSHLALNGGEIRNNTAERDGGAINIQVSALGALFVGQNMVFGGNQAREAFDHGLEAGLENFEFIRWQGENSVPGTHLLNNYDITFTGQPIVMQTVTFEANGGNILTGNLTRRVPNGGGLGANMPLNPTHPNRNAFSHWEIVEGGTEGAHFTATTSVQEDMTVQAVWSDEILAAYNEVTFNLNGGEGYFPAQVIAFGEFATQPEANPTRVGYTFLGWFWNVGIDAEYIAFDFEAVQIVIDLELVAMWEEDPYYEAEPPYVPSPEAPYVPAPETPYVPAPEVPYTPAPAAPTTPPATGGKGGNDLPPTGANMLNPAFAGVALAGIGAVAAAVKVKKK